MDYFAWLERAIQAIPVKAPMDEPFLLKSLFDDFEWERLSQSERRRFGAIFASEVKEFRISSIRRTEDAKNGSAQYIRIGE